MKVPKIINILLITIFIALVLVRSGTKIYNPDIWFQLAAGKYIYTNHALKDKDVFTYTSTKPNLSKIWLYNIFIYKIYRIFGANGLSFLKILIISLFYFSLFLIVPKNKHWLFFGFSVLFMPAIGIRFLMRPEWITYLFSAIFVLYLEKRYNPYYLLIFALLWANMHTMYPIGIFIVGLYAAYHCIRKDRRWRQLALIAALMTLIILLSKSGFSGVMFPFKVLKELLHGVRSATNISEFVSPFALNSVNGFVEIKLFRMFFILLFPLFLFYLVKTKFRPALLLAVAFAAISAIAIRNITFFFIAVVLLIPYLPDFVNKIRTAASVLLIFIGIYLLLIFSTNNFYFLNRRSSVTGFGFNRNVVPVEMSAFAKKNIKARRIFNDVSSGGILEWALFPENKVFIDGRLEMFSNKFWNEYLNAMENFASFKKLQNRFKFNTVILTLASGNGINLFKILIHKPEWNIIYIDAKSAIFVLKDTYSGKKNIVIPNLPQVKYNKHYEFYRMIKNPFYRFFTFILPKKHPFVENNLAIIEYAANKINSRNLISYVLSKYPDAAYLHYLLGNIHEINNNYNDALFEYTFAYRLLHTSEYAFKLAYINQLRGNYPQAITYYRKVKFGEKTLLRKNYNTALIYMQTKNYKKARKYAEKVYRADPQYLEIRNIMSYLYNYAR